MREDDDEHPQAATLPAGAGGYRRDRADGFGIIAG